MSKITKERQEELDKICRALSVIYPAFGSMMLYIPRRYIHKEELDIQTDGKVIKAGQKFFEHEFGEQVHLILRTVLHTALRHNGRMKDIKHNRMAVNTWLLSTSTLTNEFIKVTPGDYAKKPEDGTVYISELRLYLDVEKPDNEWTSEQLFKELYKKVDEATSAMERGESTQSQEDLMDKLEGMSEFMTADYYSDTNQILEEAGLSQEYTKGVDGLYNDMLWRERIKSALAGTKMGDLMNMIMGELPKVKTPWAKLLRQFLVCRLNPQRESNWKRPSRRNLAGSVEFFQPYWDRKKAISKLVVLLDLSGSCYSSEIFSKFVAEIDMVIGLTGCETKIITFDYSIQETFTLKSNQLFSTYVEGLDTKMKGGGGTSFIEPIEAAVTENPDAVVILTDCYGPFPEQPSRPNRFLWASIGDSAPWGKTIILED